MIIRTLRSGWLRIGGYMAHVGLAVLLAGIVGSTTYAAPDQKLVVPQGDSLSAYGYNFTFNGWRVTPEGKGVLDLTVTRGSESFQATPLLYYNDRMGATMATPSVKSELLSDLYISPAEYQPEVNNNAATLSADQSQTIGPYTITFLGFDASQAHSSTANVGARLRVVYQGKAIELTPQIHLVANESDPAKALQDVPAALPGGHSISLANFDPVQGRAVVLVNGLNLPIEPAKAVVMVSIKPGIMLVWLGVAIGVLGGLIALLRRTLEGRAQLAGRPARLPRGLGGLARFVGNR